MSDRVEIAWANFIAPIRLDSQSSTTPACSKSASTRLFKGTWEGVPVVFIEDTSLRQPGTVPWSNIASFGLLPEEKPEEKPEAPTKKGPFGRPLKPAPAEDGT